ncbi:hypothetical protein CYMTET_11844 [Cymbomonas tetramitiformis]|uniref:Uncharacterized protein n=1 Tax=Cymbomonas tetramitiformis TaxID=36881 RepID=A0AAE0GLJ7_9CHLO|nr:hypothetical protein CYMTET_11844 [Cymbomonas tetramitiformis]
MLKLGGVAGAVVTLADPAAGEVDTMQSMAAELELQLEMSEEPVAESLDEVLATELSGRKDEGEEVEEDGMTRPSEKVVQRLTDLYQLLEADSYSAPSIEMESGEIVEVEATTEDEDVEEQAWDMLRQAEGWLQSQKGALWERFAASGVEDSPAKLVDVERARKCSKFVGMGSWGSRTEQYRIAAGTLANCSEYSSEEFVMVTADTEGPERVPVTTEGALAGVYAMQLRMATQAGATIVAAPREMREIESNIGERELAEALQSELGYVEIEETGMWQPSGKAQP